MTNAPGSSDVGHQHFEVLGHRLTWIKFHTCWEVDSPVEWKQPFLLAFEGVRVPEDEAVEHVSSVSDRDGEDRCLALFNVCHAVRRVQVDAVNDVHKGSSGQVRLDCWVFVGLCSHSDVSQLIAICLVH